MYQYVRNADFLADSYPVCANLVNQLVQHLRRYDIRVTRTAIGNRKRGLIVQKDDAPVSYEFYLIVQNPEDFRPRELKEQVIDAFNEILNRNWLPNCEDTRNGITTKPMHLSKGDLAEFHIEICLIALDASNTWHRLLHFKTERVMFDEWYWCPVPLSGQMREMEYYLKPRHSLRIRRMYLDEKDSCVDRTGYECASLVCYLNVLHQVYEWAQSQEEV